MSDFLKLQVQAIWSKNSDYTNPEWITNLADFALTPDEVLPFAVDAPVAGVVVSWAPIATPTCMLIKNEDITNSVTADFDDAATANIVATIPPGGILIIQDLDTAANVTITALADTVRVKGFICGT